MIVLSDSDERGRERVLFLAGAGGFKDFRVWGFGVLAQLWDTGGWRFLEVQGSALGCSSGTLRTDPP